MAMESGSRRLCSGLPTSAAATLEASTTDCFGTTASSDLARRFMRLLGRRWAKSGGSKERSDRGFRPDQLPQRFPRLTRPKSETVMLLSTDTNFSISGIIAVNSFDAALALPVAASVPIFVQVLSPSDENT